MARGFKTVLTERNLKVVNAEKLDRSCRDKASMAKINVLISNKELKASLKEMVEFSTKTENF